MRVTGGHDIIDEYVAGLGRRLVGPARLKAELLTEARDGLVDAAEAHVDTGLAPDEARRRAVTEFGGYAEVTPGYQVELAAAQGRATALLVAMALVALRFVAPLVWARGLTPAEPGASLVAAFELLARGFDVLAVVGALAGGAALLAYGPAGRRLADPARLTRILGRVTLAFLAVHGLSGLLVMAYAVTWSPAALAWPPALGVAVAMWLGYGYAARCAWRCLRAARPDLVTA